MMKQSLKRKENMATDWKTVVVYAVAPVCLIDAMVQHFIFHESWQAIASLAIAGIWRILASIAQEALTARRETQLNFIDTSSRHAMLVLFSSDTRERALGLPAIIREANLAEA